MSGAVPPVTLFIFPPVTGGHIPRWRARPPGLPLPMVLALFLHLPSPPSYAKCTPILVHPSLTAHPFTPWHVHICISTHLDTHPSPSCQSSEPTSGPSPSRRASCPHLTQWRTGSRLLGSSDCSSAFPHPVDGRYHNPSQQLLSLTRCQAPCLGPWCIPFISQVPARL